MLSVVSFKMVRCYTNHNESVWEFNPFLVEWEINRHSSATAQNLQDSTISVHGWECTGVCWVCSCMSAIGIRNDSDNNLINKDASRGTFCTIQRADMPFRSTQRQDPPEATIEPTCHCCHLLTTILSAYCISLLWSTLIGKGKSQLTDRQSRSFFRYKSFSN